MPEGSGKNNSIIIYKTSKISINRDASTKPGGGGNQQKIPRTVGNPEYFSMTYMPLCFLFASRQAMNGQMLHLLPRPGCGRLAAGIRGFSGRSGDVGLDGTDVMITSGKYMLVEHQHPELDMKWVVCDHCGEMLFNQ